MDFSVIYYQLFKESAKNIFFDSHNLDSKLEFRAIFEPVCDCLFEQ